MILATTLMILGTTEGSAIAILKLNTFELMLCEDRWDGGLCMQAGGTETRCIPESEA